LLKRKKEKSIKKMTGLERVYKILGQLSPIQKQEKKEEVVEVNIVIKAVLPYPEHFFPPSLN
jgi:hypothetical protein